MDDRYFSIKQLAEYASLSESTLRNLLPEIPHHRLRRKVLVKQSDFDRWLLRKKRAVERFDPDVVELGNRILGIV